MYFKNGLILLKKESFLFYKSIIVINLDYCIWTGLEYKNYRPVSICKYDRKYHVDPIIHLPKVMG